MRPSQTAPPSTRSRPASGRGRRVLALGRRPLRQEHARPDPPTAGDRPRDRGVGACARRAHRGPRGAHPDRDPADADALRPGRSQPARGARVDGRARPPGAGSQAHRGHRQAPPRAGAAAAKAARAAPGAGQAPVRKGLSPEAVAAIREVVEGRPRRPARAVTSAPVDPWNPAETHLSQLIPLNPGESRSENVSGVSRPGPNTHLTPSPEAEGETQTATACSPSPPRRGGEGRGEVGGELCRLRPPRHRAADPARPEPLAARALPRPHPGLQGFRAADGGAPPGRGVT